ncbi:TatD family hydrolase [Carboxylicivirga linearis]|uniref:TatD family hydrolase n=1 Tax=Carboxylicivirga linearis TaxID=1628157 RepID=A0ABS5JVE7_9BACT|nr:TatD family hydrolase [Carboxylicivirga linearis]MBS2098803.1 TatD family hydrolase [Carboxylicivirga linearis]
MQFIDFHTHHIHSDPEITSIYNVPLEELNTSQSNQNISIGIHPWEISNINNQFNSIKQKLSQSTVLALGECGLDKIKGPDLQTQIDVFKEHTSLSEQHKKPLIIHCVKSYSEIIKLRKDIDPKQPWILHGFNSSVETMNQAIETGFYFSFGPSLVTHPKTQLTFRNTPLKRVFLETDDSNTNIKELYQKASELRDLNIEEVIEQLQYNFKLIFNNYRYL